MAQPSLLDPFALMRDLVSKIEKSVNEVANPLMQSDGFAKGANQAMSAAMIRPVIGPVENPMCPWPKAK